MGLFFFFFFFGPDREDVAAHIKNDRKLSGLRMDSPVTGHIWVYDALKGLRQRCPAFPFGGHIGKEQISPELEDEVSLRKRKSLKKFKKYKCVVKEKYTIR